MIPSKYLLLVLFIANSACTSTALESISQTYYGYLPCTDCPGIHYQLDLKKDNTYIETRYYVDRGENAFITEGNYSFESDSLVILTTENEENKYFIISEEQLTMVNKSGEPFGTEFPERYRLSAEKPADFHTSPPSDSTNLGFKATGNEPFWGLNIGFDKKVSFHAMASEEFNFNASLSKAKKHQNDSLVYEVSTNNGEAEITIVRNGCEDTMSGDEFPYSVAVIYKSGTGGETNFTGCGRYLGNFSLNDNWELTGINNEPVKITNSGRLPTLEIQLLENRLFGYSGCNRYSGEVELINGKLNIGSVVSTKMACPEMEIETAFLSALTDKDFNFEIDGEQLILFNEDRLTFRRMEIR